MAIKLMMMIMMNRKINHPQYRIPSYIYILLVLANSVAMTTTSMMADDDNNDGGGDIYTMTEYDDDVTMIATTIFV